MKNSEKFSLKEAYATERFYPELMISSPGRINLIGEHTDYNNGFVLPTAIDKTIEFYFKKNLHPSQCNIYSEKYNTVLTVDLTKITVSNNSWENYILGVLFELLKRTNHLRGFDCIIKSKLPIGAGISSSAALECGFAFGLNELFELKLSKEDIVVLSRDAEHNFAGTKCGIMDQFASVMSKKDHLILLDCEFLRLKMIPFKIDPYKIVLLNTNVTHHHATSEYNTRREECEKGLSIIKTKFPHIQSLRDLNLQQLEISKEIMPAILYKRCRYIVEENTRVLTAAEALKNNEIKVFGQCMYTAHSGQQYDFEISCPELDFLVDFSRDYKEVIGSRMMGGGFGGCTINLIHKDFTALYIQKVSTAYQHRFNIKLDALEVTSSDGTSVKYF